MDRYGNLKSDCIATRTDVHARSYGRECIAHAKTHTYAVWSQCISHVDFPAWILPARRACMRLKPNKSLRDSQRVEHANDHAHAILSLGTLLHDLAQRETLQDMLF